MKVDGKAGFEWGIATAATVLAGCMIYGAVTRQMGWIKRAAIYAAVAGVGVGGIRALVIKVPKEEKVTSTPPPFKAPVDYFPAVRPGWLKVEVQHEKLGKGGTLTNQGDVIRFVEELAPKINEQLGINRVCEVPDGLLREFEEGYQMEVPGWREGKDEDYWRYRSEQLLPHFVDGKYQMDWIIPISRYDSGHLWMNFIDFQNKQVVIADSITGRRHSKEGEQVLRWVGDLFEANQKYAPEGQNLPADFMEGWEVVVPKLDKARQKRADCGIFSIVFFAWMAHRVPIDQWQIATDPTDSNQVNGEVDRVRAKLCEMALRKDNGAYNPIDFYLPVIPEGMPKQLKTLDDVRDAMSKLAVALQDKPLTRVVSEVATYDEIVAGGLDRYLPESNDQTDWVIPIVGEENGHFFTAFIDFSHFKIFVANSSQAGGQEDVNRFRELLEPLNEFVDDEEAFQITVLDPAKAEQKREGDSALFSIAYLLWAAQWKPMTERQIAPDPNDANQVNQQIDFLRDALMGGVHD